MRGSANFYSNCLIEALKAKIKHPIKTKIKIVVIPNTLCPHFRWINNNKVKEFGTDGELKWYNLFLYKGYIRTCDIKTYKKMSKQFKWNIVGNI